MESNCGKSEEKCHAPHSAEQYATTSNTVDEHEVDPSEEKVCCGNNGADCDWIGKADECEQSGRVCRNQWLNI
jgi:hypothetical protein